MLVVQQTCSTIVFRCRITTNVLVLAAVQFFAVAPQIAAAILAVIAFGPPIRVHVVVIVVEVVAVVVGVVVMAVTMMVVVVMVVRVAMDEQMAISEWPWRSRSNYRTTSPNGSPRHRGGLGQVRNHADRKYCKHVANHPCH